ncbi:hypothetical protein BG454_05435 [Roseinatronobacter bogoriensis subsp. barguzinensis]|uniref:Uncharacterized protein n=1 Tax=Roseinatronobacter bogoriensis subsp. barguzinensis TaxID=441209 RepID=A0A2K8KBP3_9RHOB|nr:hypothetical protein BG454_05435 [Rhodobaca barguzinensis]
MNAAPQRLSVHSFTLMLGVLLFQISISPTVANAQSLELDLSGIEAPGNPKFISKIDKCLK